MIAQMNALLEQEDALETVMKHAETMTEMCALNGEEQPPVLAQPLIAQEDIAMPALLILIVQKALMEAEAAQTVTALQALPALIPMHAPLQRHASQEPALHA